MVSFLSNGGNESLKDPDLNDYNGHENNDLE